MKALQAGPHSRTTLSVATLAILPWVSKSYDELQSMVSNSCGCAQVSQDSHGTELSEAIAAKIESIARAVVQTPTATILDQLTGRSRSDEGASILDNIVLVTDAIRNCGLADHAEFSVHTGCLSMHLTDIGLWTMTLGGIGAASIYILYRLKQELRENRFLRSDLWRMGVRRETQENYMHRLIRRHQLEIAELLAEEPTEGPTTGESRRNSRLRRERIQRAAPPPYEPPIDDLPPTYEEVTAALSQPSDLEPESPPPAPSSVLLPAYEEEETTTRE